MTMNRRDFLALVSSGVAAGSAVAGLALPSMQIHAAPGQSSPQKRQHRPNVVLMICDDLGYGDLGCDGSNLPTPNLDRMAAEGLRCTHFNASHPICSASRAGLLTGRYGLRSNVGSEVAHRVAPMLATVRRSNRACSFPAHGFHEDSLFWDAIEGINRIRFTSPYSPYSLRSGSCFHPMLRQRLQR